MLLKVELILLQDVSSSASQFNGRMIYVAIGDKTHHYCEELTDTNRQIHIIIVLTCKHEVNSKGKASYRVKKL